MKPRAWAAAAAGTVKGVNDHGRGSGVDEAGARGEVRDGGRQGQQCARHG